MNYFNGLLAETLSAGMLQSGAHPRIVQTLISNHDRRGLPRLKKIQSRLIFENQTAFFQRLRMPGTLAAKNGSLLLNLFLSLILLVPAITGLLLNMPLYFPLKKIIQQKTKNTVFYDSVMFAALIISYPVYWLVLNVIFQPLAAGNALISILLLFMPLLGWISIYWRECFLRVRNYLALSGKERNILRSMVSGSHAL
jgi:hypothetical protein